MMMMPSNWAGDEVASLLKPNKISMSQNHQDSGK
jgi:hypothetical protein